MARPDRAAALLARALPFLIGCGTALNNPAWQSSVGDMVPRGGHSGRRAHPLNSASFNLARSVGPGGSAGGDRGDRGASKRLRDQSR